MTCGNCKKDYMYKDGEGLFCHSCTSKVKPLWMERLGTFPKEWEIFAWELEDGSLLRAETIEESADSDVDEIQWGGGNRTPSPERQAAPASASDDEWGEKPFEESFAPRARFKFQETKGGASGTPGQATRGPRMTAISTSVGLFVKHQKREAWSFINNGKEDEDRMRELRERFGMDLTCCERSMSHLEGKDRQTLGDLIKSMTTATDPKEAEEARQRPTQPISDNNVGRMDVEQMTAGMGNITLRRTQHEEGDPVEDCGATSFHPQAAHLGSLLVANLDEEETPDPNTKSEEEAEGAKPATQDDAAEFMEEQEGKQKPKKEARR